ncbi:LysR family transcriptional regulator [Risungbinella massiliensis]|uniref:LysR family transcriptional regulator n=1 Tax=Risungbinella massiliensis TaxID=1329796 RepID=UPI0005CC9050|nr:LysR family transcriptional regulator [Risungbinella massiliensis]
MELRQLQYFIEVAKREHVTEASNALHVAQSAISRQISSLEDELGVPLFHREGRNIRLTVLGKIFLHHAEAAIREIEKAQQVMKEYLDPERGTIRLGFPSSLAANTLPTIISAFRKQHPHVGFQLRQGSYKYLIDAVRKAEIDISLIGPVPTSEKDIDGHVLFVERIDALLPMTHPKANQSTIRLSDLQQDSFVLFPTKYILHKIVVEACQMIGFTPKVSFEGEDIDAIKGLVATGLGVTLLPEVTLHENIPRGTKRIPISEPPLKRNVGIITPNNRKLPPSEQIFYQFVIQFFDQIYHSNQFV